MKKIPLLLITIFLAIVPFFWFNHGEINLGGDSSRLYFYDPINYLKSFSLYGISPSQTGEEMISYFFVPFTLFLAVLKIIFTSPHLLINVFHSFMLATSFLAIYLIIIELVGQKKNSGICEVAAITGGLFYALTPVIGLNWDKALVTHNQVFLNPLIFLLLLRFVNTKKTTYLLLILLITFIFAPNFSFISAPPFFAFYPSAIAYLFVYGHFIKKINFPWKKIAVLTILFVIIHSFHLIPQIAVLLDRTSSSFQRVFTTAGSSEALGYFSSVYPNIKLTNNFAGLPQLQKPLFPFDFLVFVFPAVLIVGLLFNFYRSRENVLLSKNFLLLFIFFLIALFFDTANITSIGVSFYKSLFQLPGFGMFRNFYGQFMYVFYFFYALVLGHALFFVLSAIEVKKRVILSASLVILLIANGWLLIKGDVVNQPIFQSELIRVPHKIDPNFEEVLEYIRKNSEDGKFVTLPLTDFGYQVLAGTEGGVYIGPSTIGYLTGKKDFPGYVGFAPFADLFLRLVERQDYVGLKNLLAIFNIKYIFYNEDLYIYENFPKFPYETMKRVFPTQQSYKNFLKKLGFRETFSAGKYHIYEIAQTEYLPHFYTAKTIIPTKSIKDWEFLLPSYSFSKDRIFVDSSSESQILVHPDKVDVYSRIKKDFPIPVQYPFAKWKLDSVVYPLVVTKENYFTEKAKGSEDAYIDTKLFFSAKRTSELAKWEGGISLEKGVTDREQLLNYQQKFRFLGVPLWRDYGSWETSLSRYVAYIDEIVNLIDNSKNTLSWKIEKKSKAYNALSDHQTILNLIVKNSTKSNKDKEYLFKLLNEVFSYYLNKVKVTEYNPLFIEYTFTPDKEISTYEVFVKKEFIKEKDFSNYSISINNKILRPLESQFLGQWVSFGKVDLDKKEHYFTINSGSYPIEDNIPWQAVNSISVAIGLEPSDFPNKILLENLVQSLISVGVEMPANLATAQREELIRTISKQKNKIQALETEIERLRLGFKDQEPKQQYTSTSLEKAKTASLETFSLENKPFSGFLKQVKNFSSDGHYLISFDYHTHGDTTEIGIFAKNKDKNVNASDTGFRLIYKEKKIAKTWRKFNAVIDTRNIDEILFSINVAEKKLKKSKIDVKNFSISRLPLHPEVLFKEVENFPTADNVPKITFTQINPTKYKVKIREAREPYTLIFSDAFSANWKVYLSDSLTEGKDIIASYFDGDVKEGFHKNIFLNSDTFETWGKKPIAYDSHFLANGYANGWYIIPQDVGGKTDYELIVEMTRQKLFYGSMAISLLGLGVVIVWFVISLKRHGSS